MQFSNLILAVIGTFACSTAIATPLPTSEIEPRHKKHWKTIQRTIEDLDKTVYALNNFLGHGDIGLLKAGRVYLKAKAIGKQTKNGVKQADHSQNLDNVEAYEVLLSTEKLINSVNITMENVIDHWANFASLPLVPVVPLPFIPHADVLVYSVLQSLATQSRFFGSAVLEKIPDTGRHDGETRLKRIYAGFDKAVAKYEKKHAVLPRQAAGADAELGVADYDISDKDFLYFNSTDEEDDLKEEE